MQKANLDLESPVKFDLSKVFGACPNKGKLGCFKVEEGADVIHAGVFLLAKMYALKPRWRCARRAEGQRDPKKGPQAN